MSKKNHKKKNNYIAPASVNKETTEASESYSVDASNDIENEGMPAGENAGEIIENTVSEEVVAENSVALEDVSEEATVYEAISETKPEGETDSDGESEPDGETDAEGEPDPEGETDPDGESDPEGETDPDVKQMMEEVEKDIDSSEEKKEKERKRKEMGAADPEVRKEAARVAKNRSERSKVQAIAKENDEKRIARHKRRVRNQVIAYVVVILLVLLILAGGFWAYMKFIRKAPVSEPVDGKIDVSEGTEQTEEIISGMLGMEDDISEPVVEEPVVVETPDEPEADPLGDFVKEQIASMSIEDKVASLFVVTPESITGTAAATVAGDATKAALEKYAVGGIVYSDINISNKDQFSTMIEKTNAMVKYPTFIAIAEEGGVVEPLANAGFYTAEGSPANIAATNDVTGAYSAGITISFTMKEMGLNLNFAPVADLSVADNNILGDRCYSNSAADAVGYVQAMMKGIQDGKVTACVKYFPGLGMVTDDPAKGRVVSDRTDEEFSSGEFLVYQALIDDGAKMIMISNAVYSAYSDVPASLSSDVIGGILRERLGYEGIVISGNLSDAAISQYYGADEASIMALKAGCDMIMCPEDFVKAYEGVLKAVSDNVVSEQRIDDALERILRVKYAENFEE